MVKNLQIKTNIIFFQIIAIGLVFLTLILFFVLKLFPKINLAGKSLLGKLEIICGCANHFSFTHHPYLFVSLILAGIGMVMFFSFVIYKILKIKRSTNQFVQTNLNSQKTLNSAKLKSVIRSVNLENKVIEINSKGPIIFCYGFLKERICISSEIVKKLSSPELKAILLHEKYHLQTHEPIKLLAVKSIASILFFIPGIKSLLQKYCVFSELTADEYATKGFKDQSSLAKALYKIIIWKEQSIKCQNLALSYFSITEDRINQLVDKNYAFRLKFLTPQILSGIIFIFAIFFSFNTLVLKANHSAATYHNENICQKMQVNPVYQCQFMKKMTCDNNYSSMVHFCNN